MSERDLSHPDKGAKVKEFPLLFNASAKGNENINYSLMQYEVNEKE